MKNIIHISMLIMMLTGMACVSPSSIAAASDCKNAYFSPDDFNHEHPLLKPYPDFMESYKLAKAGNAVEQRNVAVSYDAGYLVNACPEKAHYWYQKAAGNGDRIAQNWIARYNQFKTMSEGPEFAITNPVNPPQARASTPTKIAGTGQPASAEAMLAELSQQPNSKSAEGKIIEIGQLMGDLMRGQAAQASAHQEPAR